MLIQICDRSRNVRIAPAKAFGDGDDPLAVMDALMFRHPTENGRIEFEADKEFLTRAGMAAEGTASPLTKLAPPWPPTHGWAYRGVPIMLVDA